MENQHHTDEQDKTQSTEWQQDMINRLAFSSLKEQRAARRWGIFFKILMFVYLALILYLYTPKVDMDVAEGDKHTALIDLEGVIASDEDANADNIIEGLRDAFEDENSAGIILRINSPGGSPVQAGYINDEIQRLRTEYPDKPLYAVISDICASGGYYIAAAADKVYADKASIVGSIGVRMDGFGFVDAMQKLGVERRLLTAGENKGFLDPFEPVKAGDVKHVQELLDDIHQQFIQVVRDGRGEKLQDNSDLFSGYVWDYTPAEDWLQKFSKRFGTAMGRGVGQVLGGQFTLK